LQRLDPGQQIPNCLRGKPGINKLGVVVMLFFNIPANGVETLAQRAATRGLRIKSERYALLNGTLYPRPGVQVELRGARMFGGLVV